MIAKVSFNTLIYASPGIAKHTAASYPCLQIQSEKEKKEHRKNRTIATLLLPTLSTRVNSRANRFLPDKSRFEALVVYFHTLDVYFLIILFGIMTPPTKAHTHKKEC